MQNHVLQLLMDRSMLWDLALSFSIFEVIGIFACIYFSFRLIAVAVYLLGGLMQPTPRKVVVGLKKEEVEAILKDMPKFDPSRLVNEQSRVYKWDPSTLDYFGETPAMSKDDVDAIVARAKVAQSKWKHSSFTQVSIQYSTFILPRKENRIKRIYTYYSRFVCAAPSPHAYDVEIHNRKPRNLRTRCSA